MTGLCKYWDFAKRRWGKSQGICTLRSKKTFKNSEKMSEVDQSESRHLSYPFPSYWIEILLSNLSRLELSGVVDISLTGWVNSIKSDLKRTGHILLLKRRIFSVKYLQKPPCVLYNEDRRQELIFFWELLHSK